MVIGRGAGTGEGEGRLDAGGGGRGQGRTKERGIGGEIRRSLSYGLGKEEAEAHHSVAHQQADHGTDVDPQVVLRVVVREE